MAAVEFDVHIGIGELVEKQQITHQEEGDEGGDHRGEGDLAAECENRSKHHQGAKTEAGSNEAKERAAVQPAGIDDDNENAQSADEQDRPAALQEKVDANENIDRQAADTSVEGDRRFFRLRPERAAASTEGGRGRLQVQTAADIFVLIDGIDRRVGGDGADESEDHGQGGHYNPCMQHHCQPQKHAGWSKDQKRRTHNADNCFHRLIKNRFIYRK